MAGWTFITKHAVALSLVARYPRITALALSSAMGITERSVRKVIADLYASGYISKKRVGRGIRYRINPDMLLSDVTHGEVAIGDFLEALGWRRRRKVRKEVTV